MGIKLGKPAQSVLEQSRDLGPISARKVLRTQIVTVSGADLLGELSDESRFRKFVGLHLPPLRHIVGDARACIGRQFALHEAVLALGLILHRFV